MTDEMTAWLSTRPQEVQALAREFPPGMEVAFGDATIFVLGYCEGDTLIVTPVDPHEDYNGAYEAREHLCASHLRGKLKLRGE
jgi:hypothetical protein